LVSEVDVSGEYYGSGPAASENVFFYENSSGLPGKLVKSFSDLDGADGSSGSFEITLPKAIKLKAGTYWVSVVANCAYDTCGEWDWDVRSVQNGYPAAWRSPNGGNGTKCENWGTLESCTGYGPDFMWDLKGVERKK
jgi:hypothetical protein